MSRRLVDLQQRPDARQPQDITPLSGPLPSDMKCDIIRVVEMSKRHVWHKVVCVWFAEM